MKPYHDTSIEDLHERIAFARRDRGYFKVTDADFYALREKYGYIYETGDGEDHPFVLVREKQYYRNDADFRWGKIIERHHIGEYEFIEHIPNQASNVSDEDYEAEGGTNQRHFSALINGRSIGRSYTSLDAALVGVVAYKYDGNNTRADRYFLKSIGAS